MQGARRNGMEDLYEDIDKVEFESPKQVRRTIISHDIWLLQRNRHKHNWTGLMHQEDEAFFALVTILVKKDLCKTNLESYTS